MATITNTFIRTKQHKKKKKEQHKTAVYSLAYIYIKQVVRQINSWTLRHKYIVRGACYSCVHCYDTLYNVNSQK